MEMTTTRRKRTSTTRSETPVALALGGNVGSPAAVEQTLRRAVRDLESALGPLQIASLYRTAAVQDYHGLRIRLHDLFQ